MTAGQRDDAGSRSRADPADTADLQPERGQFEAREQQFRAAIESSPIGIVVIDNEGQIVLVNSETEKLFGYTRDELIGELIEILVPVRSRSAHPVLRESFFANPSSRRMGAGRDLFGRRKDASEFPIEIGLNPVQTGERVLALATIIDITERKRHERKLAQYAEELERSNTELDQFAVVAAHDLRTPARQIVALCKLSREESGPDAELPYLAEIESAGQRMLDLMDNLLELARISTANTAFVATDLVAVVADVLTDLREQLENAQATVTVGRLPTVSGDGKQLYQLFANLIGNALKFRRRDVTPIIDVCSEKQDGNWRLIVRDNGTGFDLSARHEIFTVFKRLHATDQPGAGVGLAI